MSKGLKKINSVWGDYTVAATKPYITGETVLCFEGEVVSTNQLTDFCHSLQIGPNLYLGPSGKEDDYINHCCDPNCFIREDAGRFYLVTLKPVAVDEELTFDYSTTMLDDPTSFLCRCGVDACRGTIKSFNDLSEELKQHYIKLGLAPRFVYKNGTH